jgi:hypothetical protein
MGSKGETSKSETKKDATHRGPTMIEPLERSKSKRERPTLDTSNPWKK